MEAVVDLADLKTLSQPADTKVLLLVLDGLGGLPLEPGGSTELEAARTPNLDRLLARGAGGVHVPVAQGITPGSGPGHLALFGFDPLRYRIGRGVLEALGVEFELRPGDIAVRGNLCTVDADGNVTDRRAGRIPTDEAVPVCELLDSIEVEGAEVFVQAVKEHRFLLVVRSDELTEGNIEDTDPERTGVAPLGVQASDAASEPAARAVQAWLQQVPALLRDQPRANMVLLRGFAVLPDWPKFPDVFGMRSAAIAAYPMYRGVARLVGMDAYAVEDTPVSLVEELSRLSADYDFFFLHVKGTDKAGEDGDFDRKVAVIEQVDAIIPDLLASIPDAVVLVTGDHSTPALMKAHSWHPVPFLLSGGPARSAGEPAAKFGEATCAGGAIGSVRGCDLMPLAVARAARLTKFGA
jgi:2,3-bisphosphoglycerate-independent phosphoglycerate mutase